MISVAGAACGFDRTKALAWLEQEWASSGLGRRERAFLLHGSGNPVQFVAAIEGLWTLAWSMGITPVLDFSRECDDSLIEQLPDLRKAESTSGFRARMVPLPCETIVAALDLAFCLHWAVRDAMLAGKPSPGRVKPQVVVERRRALEWLLGRAEWDEVSLDT